MRSIIIVQVVIASIWILKPNTSFAQPYKVKLAFTLKEASVVEGMTFDPVQRHFYFGEDSGFRLLRYDLSGNPAGYIDAAKDGMTSVLGMTVTKSPYALWACGAITVDSIKVRCLFQYDLTNGKLINRYPDTSRQAKLFNDVAITSDGAVYTTDSYTKSLYKADLSNKVMVKYMEHELLADGNGITAVGMALYISSSKGLTRVNTNDKSISLAQLKNWSIIGSDGLYHYKGSLIGIQNVYFPPVVARYYLDSSGTRVTRGETIAAGHPQFAIPTTGAIDGDTLYLMGNNNIATGKSERKRITVLRIRLK